MTAYVPKSEVLLALAEVGRTGRPAARKAAILKLGRCPSITKAMEYVTESALWPKGRHTALTRTQLLHMAQNADERGLDKKLCAAAVISGIELGRPHDKTIVASMQRFMEGARGVKQTYRSRLSANGPRC